VYEDQDEVIKQRRFEMETKMEGKEGSVVHIFSIAPDGLANPSASGLDLSIQAEQRAAKIVKY